MERDRPAEPIMLNYASVRTKAALSLIATILRTSVALIVLLLIAAFVVPTSGHRGRSAWVGLTKANMGYLTSPLELFRQAMGRYPRDLKELHEMPANEAEARRWAGPYIDNPDKLKDAWGRSFRYRAPGVKNPTTYDLWSTGKDGVSGTSDDICNWR
jgi:general secretion pathway protein G